VELPGRWVVANWQIRLAAIYGAACLTLCPNTMDKRGGGLTHGTAARSGRRGASGGRGAGVQPLGARRWGQVAGAGGDGFGYLLGCGTSGGVSSSRAR